MSMELIRQHYKKILIIGMFIFFFLQLTTLISDVPFKNDASQNAKSAYYLSQHGVISVDKRETDDPSPSNFREPVPIFVVAAIIQIQEKLLGHEFSLETINSDGNPKIFKSANILWALVLLAAIYVLTHDISQSFSLSILASLVSYFAFVANPLVIDTLFTELQAATLLTLTVMMIVKATRSVHVRNFAWIGIFAGLLSLTKASFFYIFIGIALLFIVVFLIRKERDIVKRVLLSFAIFAAIAASWMTRNFFQFGEFEITQRGGVVLLGRAYYDLMSQEEMVGSLYHWGPPSLKNISIKPYWDFSAEDFEIGGSMQRLKRSVDILRGKPDDPITYYFQARAERNRLREYYRKQKEEFPNHLADNDVQSQAIGLITENPVRHLVMTGIFTWRGIWDLRIFKASNNFSDTSNLVLFLSLMLGIPVYAFRKKDFSLFAFWLLPFAAISFFAIFSHNIPRYSRMVYPLKIISFLLIAHFAYSTSTFPKKIIDKIRSKKSPST